MKKIFTIMFLGFSSIGALNAQFKGAFSDVYIYRSMFADIPGQVKIFKVSASFFFAS
ncbi:MAG TPA: hypothetical protein VF691_10810 [Cytophagaceae bacterium]